MQHWCWTVSRFPGQFKDSRCHLKPVGGIYGLAYTPLYSSLFLLSHVAINILKKEIDVRNSSKDTAF